MAATATVNWSSADEAAQPSVGPGTMTDDHDRDDDDNDGGGGIMDGVAFPFKALQLYNVVTGYLEYFYDTVIAPIAGDFHIFVNFLRPSLPSPPTRGVRVRRRTCGRA